MTPPHAGSPPQTYIIRIAGGLDGSWSDWFDGLDIQRRNGETILAGTVPDQAALFGILAKIARLNLVLISVERVEQGTDKFLQQGGKP